MERAIARNRVRQTKGGVVFVVIFYLVSVLHRMLIQPKLVYIYSFP